MRRSKNTLERKIQEKQQAIETNPYSIKEIEILEYKH